MAWRFPVPALHCGDLKPSDPNATVDSELTFDGWSRLIVSECSVATAPTFSALLQIARRMTYLTRLHKQDYKKNPAIEDIIHWTTGVDEVLDDDGEIEVDRVPPRRLKDFTAAAANPSSPIPFQRPIMSYAQYANNHERNVSNARRRCT